MKGNKSQHSGSILGVTGDVVPNRLGPNEEVQNNVSGKSLDNSMENSGYRITISQNKVCLVPESVVLLSHNYLSSPLLQ